MHAPMIMTGLAWLAWPKRGSGFWLTLQTYVAGKVAVALERERSAMLVAIVSAVPLGATLHDFRVDGTAVIVQNTAVNTAPAPEGTDGEE